MDDLPANNASQRTKVSPQSKSARSVLEKTNEDAKKASPDAVLEGKMRRARFLISM